MKFTITLLSAVLLVTVSSNAMAGEKILIAGGSDGVWAVRQSADRSTHDILFRPVGGKWKWVADGIQGSPVAIADANNCLHVIYAGSKGYLIFESSPDAAPIPCHDPQSPYWPAGANPIAFCDANGLAMSGKPTVLAIVAHPYVVPSVSQEASHPASSEPASQPVSASEPSPFGQIQPVWLDASAEDTQGLKALAVFVNVDDRWKHVADLGPVRLAKDDRVLATVVENRLYVLIAFHDGRYKLASWQNYKWTELELQTPPGLHASQPVATLDIDNKLTIVWQCQGPQSAPAGQKPPATFQIAVRDTNGDFRFMPVTRDGQPAILNATDGPFFVRSDKYIGVVWQQGAVWQFALWSESNQLLQAEYLGPEGSPPGAGEKNYHDYFMYGLMVCIFAVMFLMRPRRESQPLSGFILPKQFAPAGLGKRLAAGLVDLVPFLGGAYLIFPTDLTVQELFNRMMQDKMPENLVLAVITGYGSYGVYCIIMERIFAATVGKMIFGLKVVGNEGKPADTREILLRNLIKVLEISTLWLLLIIPLFNRNRQRLADLIARTAVIDKWHVQPPEEDESDYI